MGGVCIPVVAGGARVQRVAECRLCGVSFSGMNELQPGRDLHTEGVFLEGTDTRTNKENIPQSPVNQADKEGGHGYACSRTDTPPDRRFKRTVCEEQIMQKKTSGTSYIIWCAATKHCFSPPFAGLLLGRAALTTCPVSCECPGTAEPPLAFVTAVTVPQREDCATPSRHPTLKRLT
ncbi:hypothetical protein E2C01_063378 [Portunus trituberculatus]|uniref:Uncharacterized protein n=1 Tax=Portunus trituberculatus TaxID=210409 RepID=A0A5B7HG77_PORTR|nr:hypothetical protein [Portunus trituberculatus]